VPRGALLINNNTSTHIVHRRMTQQQVIDKILSIVSEQAQLPRQQIVNGKTYQCVDARYIALSLMLVRGVYPSVIADYLAISKRTTQRAQSCIVQRMRSSYCLRQLYDNCLQQLRQTSDSDTTHSD
jgi:FixJ family two-component response regulator